MGTLTLELLDTDLPGQGLRGDFAAWGLWLRCVVPELYPPPALDLTTLSPLERRTLYCQLSGHFRTAPQIAAFLDTSPTTVRMAMTRTRQKIGAALAN